MKRLTLLFLVLLMFVSCVLAACEGSPQESSEKPVSESNAISFEESLHGESEFEVESSSAFAESSEEALVSEEESVESTEPEESSEEEESEPEESSKEEESKPDESSKGEESDTEKEIQRVKVLFTRYTQKPVFVMIGTCEQGAQITAEFEGQTVTVPSYMGWFEFSLENKSYTELLNVTVYQTVNGKKYEAQSIKARATEPSYLGTRAIGSNGAFQFFLEQMVADYEGKNLFSESILNSMKDRVSSRLDQIHQYNKNAEIIYMIVPSPMTTYPELVPERYVKTNGITAFDQITGKLKEAG